MNKAIICNNLKFLYVSIPKCACTSLKHWIYEIEFDRKFEKYKKDNQLIHIHNDRGFNKISLQNLPEEKKDYKRIIIVRDPIKRFISAYSNRIIYYKELSEKSAYKDKIETANLKFNPDINYLVKNIEAYQNCSKSILHHTRPIVNFLGTNLSLYTHIYPIQEINRITEEFLHESNLYSYLKTHTLPEIPRLQTGGHKLNLDVLEPSSFDKLIYYYAPDYELLENYYPLEKIKDQYISSIRSTNFYLSNTINTLVFFDKKQNKIQEKIKIDNFKQSFTIDKSLGNTLTKQKKFDSVLIVTYGRSGSTLLQGILNSIEGWLVRGENNNFCFSLYEAYQSIKFSKKFEASTEVTKPWYGASFIDEDNFLRQASQMTRDLVISNKKNDPRIKCYGFKEIRYYLPKVQKNFDDYLEFLEKIFPNVCFIFNTRNLDNVLQSGWWPERDYEKTKQQLVSLENKFIYFCRTHNNNTFQITYEDVVSKSKKLEAMFDFLDVEYIPEKIDEILSVPHSYNIKIKKNHKEKPIIIRVNETNNDSKKFLKEERQFSINTLLESIKENSYQKYLYWQMIALVSRKKFDISEDELVDLKKLHNYAPNSELSNLINYAINNVETRRNNYLELSNYQYKIISLGSHCMSRTIPTRWGLKLPKIMGELTHPFDLSIHPYKAVCQLIKNDFQDYLNPLFLKQNKNGVPINKKYKITFNHEKNEYFYKNEFSELIKTYERRIKNFYIDISRFPILFLHVNHPKKNIIPIELAEIVEDKFADVYHKFLYINTDESGFDLSSSKLPKNMMAKHIPYPYEGYIWHSPKHYASEAGKNFELSIINTLKQVIFGYFPKIELSSFQEMKSEQVKDVRTDELSKKKSY